jgi:transcriptional regulator with XRE-family HTH domain
MLQCPTSSFRKDSDCYDRDQEHAMRTIGNKICEARESARLSQRELADLVGVKAPMISLYESGTRMPSLSVFVKVCSALNIDPNFLLSDKIGRKVCIECGGHGWILR